MFFAAKAGSDHTQYPVGKPLLRGSIGLSNKLSRSQGALVNPSPQERPDRKSHKQARNQFRASLHAKFYKDMPQMELYGLFRNLQSMPNFRIS